MEIEARETVQAVRTSFFEREIEITPTDAMLKELYRSEAMVEGMAETLARAHHLADLDDVELLIAISADGITKTATYVKMFREEREHLIKVVNACKINGVLDAQAKLIDTTADMIGLSMVNMLQTLGHDINDPAVRAAARAFIDEVADRRQEALEAVDVD